MVTPIGELPGKLDRLQKFVLEGRKETVIDVALFAKKEFLAGPPRTGLSRSAKLAGKSWGAGFDLEPTGRDYRATVKYDGPVHWWNSGTDPHPIVPSGFVGSRASRVAAANGLGRLRYSSRKVSRGKKKALSFGGNHPVTVVRHPGMRARPFWPLVEQRVRQGAPKIAAENLRGNIARAGFGAASDLKKSLSR